MTPKHLVTSCITQPLPLSQIRAFLCTLQMCHWYWDSSTLWDTAWIFQQRVPWWSQQHWAIERRRRVWSQVWTLRKKIPTKKSSQWLLGLKFKNKQTTTTNKNPEPSSHFYMGASHTNCISGRNLHWATCWLYVSAIWASPYKGVPGILFQPIGLRLSPSNQSCATIYPPASSLTNQSGSILTNQDSTFWTNQTARI